MVPTTPCPRCRRTVGRRNDGSPYRHLIAGGEWFAGWLTGESGPYSGYAFWYLCKSCRLPVIYQDAEWQYPCGHNSWSGWDYDQITEFWNKAGSLVQYRPAA